MLMTCSGQADKSLKWSVPTEYLICGEGTVVGTFLLTLQCLWDLLVHCLPYQHTIPQSSTVTSQNSTTVFATLAIHEAIDVKKGDCHAKLC